jgi:hypothetical protein
LRFYSSSNQQTLYSDKDGFLDLGGLPANSDRDCLRPQTGGYVWHYQTTPGDSSDFTATWHTIKRAYDLRKEMTGSTAGSGEKKVEAGGS